MAYEDEILNRMRQPQKRGLGDSIARFGSILATGQPPKDEDGATRLANQMALMQFKNQLPDKNQEMTDLKMKNMQSQIDSRGNVDEGYATEADIPKMVGGLPIKEISSKGGRFVPSYGQPSGGGVFGDSGQTIGDYTKEGEDYLSTLSPKDAGTVKALSQYTSNPKEEFAGMKASSDREKYIAGARHYDPSYDPMEYKKRADYLKDFSSGKRSTNRLAGNTLIKHMGSLESTLQDVPSSGVALIEKGQRLAAKQLPGIFPKQANAMTEEDSALNAVAGELSNVFKQTGGTDVEISHWLDAYDKNSPRELKQAYIKKGVELLQGRISAMGNEYEQTMGRPYKGDLLSPEAKTISERMMFKNPFNDVKQPSSDGNSFVPPNGGKVISKRYV